jgi:hypothetical protein
MLKTIIRTTACLAVSAAAFIVIAKMDAHAGARSRSAAPADEETKEAAPAKSASTPKKPKEPPPKLTVASLSSPAKTASGAPLAALPSTARPDADSTLTVPDWKGKRLSVARREARKLGFTVAAVDENGEAVPADVASSYRVRRQLTAAGSPIEPGTEVQLRVREIYDSAAGY